MAFDGSGGFFLSLLTESFAVRALLGSLAAAGLAALAVRQKWVRGSKARRALVLTPVVAVALAAGAVAVTGGGYLPQLWVATGSQGPAGQILELLGELRVVSTTAGVDVLLGAYILVAGVLLLRRCLGLVACRRLLRRAEGPAGHGELVPMVHRLADRMGLETPRVAVLPGCPGGAFTAGVVRPAVVLDPALLDSLDERELEGLLAHELAHIRRRDTLLWLLVGICRDLTFFLPPLHLAARWLRHEQETNADDLASQHTGRPGALASSILKVWDSARAAPAPRMACAVIGAGGGRGSRLALAGGGSVSTAGVSPAARAVAARIERLLERPVLTTMRRRAEIAFVLTVACSAAVATVAVPGWVASKLNAYSVSFVYLSAPPTVEVESPAFATFRALVPERTAEDRMRQRASTAGALAPAAQAACPCIESQAQLRHGEAAGLAARHPQMLWHAPTQDAWAVMNLRERTDLQSRPLWTLSESGPQVGVFVLTRAN